LSTPTSSRTAILLDVDGVLVHPVGYKAALTATVNTITAAMGLPAWGPDENEIATFEACGITNEWDSTAMCVSLLLRAALHRRPDLARDSLDATFAAIRESGVRLDRPDFVGAARQIEEAHNGRHMPSRVYLDLLEGQLGEHERALVHALLGDVYNLATLTTRLFQAFTLGSAHFESTYRQPAPFEGESYLITRDLPLLSPEMRRRLIDWASQPGHGATIFTARPSLPPNGTRAASSVYSPEAELAAELLGLDGAIPLVAQGGVGWIAERHGRQPSDYVKPSPVQALAALGAALSRQTLESLEAAAALVETGRLGGPLAALAEGSTRVILFEDSVTGIRAARLAVEQMRGKGLAVELEAVGVSPHEAKRATLRAQADHVVDDVNEGLALIFDRGRN